MVRRLLSVLAILVIFSLLAACSGQEQIDPNTIDVELITEPVEVVANEEAELSARLFGIETSTKAEVAFDIRVDNKPKLIDGVDEGDNVFSGRFTFPKAGNYKVYIHISLGNAHVTKMKRVEVR